MALTDKLTAIGDAIRAKTGDSEKLTLDQMPTEIASISSGGGSIEVEPIVLTGDQKYGCSGSLSGNYINMFGNTITTKDITAVERMFYNCDTVETIPFDINIDNTVSTGAWSYMFSQCYNLKHIPNIDCKHKAYTTMTSLFSSCEVLEELPYLYNAYPNSVQSIFNNCRSLRNIPEDYFDTWNFNRINTYKSANLNNMFQYCYSLRNIPTKVLSYFCRETVEGKGSTYHFYSYCIQNCISLDEIIGFPVANTALGSYCFNSTFDNCHRLKRITFETNEDGTPKIAKWNNQILDFTVFVGWVNTSNKKHILNYNSGITADKEVSGIEQYHNLKNDPDWFTCNQFYSRYNHDSAVETINSLPDTSAYLAANGGTNTIKFMGNAGQNTDGGAINTLTEEEIAVAAAKGWTVSFR